MHELTDDIRHFIYQEKDELGYDLYLSIRMKMVHKYKKGEIDLKKPFSTTAYNFIIEYMQKIKKDKNFETFDEQKVYFKKLLKISKFCIADISLKEKGVKYSWLVRKNEKYI
jgi:hypothetical protein